MVLAFVFLLFVGFTSAFLLAFAVVWVQNRAKTQAVNLIETGITDRKKARRVLKTLSTCFDNEGKRLYNKLDDML